jgi:hypothetical protein
MVLGLDKEGINYDAATLDYQNRCIGISNLSMEIVEDLDLC